MTSIFKNLFGFYNPKTAVRFWFGLIKYVNDSTLPTAVDNNERPVVHDAGGGLLICAPANLCNPPTWGIAAMLC